MTAPIAVEELDGLLAAEVPCGSCGRSAQLRSFGHRGGSCGLPIPGPYFKCVVCYQTWVMEVAGIIARFGGTRCRGCDVRFTDINDFSMYRTF